MVSGLSLVHMGNLYIDVKMMYLKAVSNMWDRTTAFHRSSFSAYTPSQPPGAVKSTPEAPRDSFPLPYPHYFYAMKMSCPVLQMIAISPKQFPAFRNVLPPMQCPSKPEESSSACPHCLRDEAQMS